MCTECGAVLIDVRPVSCSLEQCECTCGKVGTLEGLTKIEVKMLARINALAEMVEALERLCQGKKTGTI